MFIFLAQNLSIYVRISGPGLATPAPPLTILGPMFYGRSPAPGTAWAGLITGFDGDVSPPGPSLLTPIIRGQREM